MSEADASHLQSAHVLQFQCLPEGLPGPGTPTNEGHVSGVGH